MLLIISLYNTRTLLLSYRYLFSI